MNASDSQGSIPVTVTVDDNHLAVIDELAERLRTAGMDVEQVLGPIGVITGSAPPGWEALVDLDGVAGVEPQRTMRLPPPGTPQ
ncbi:MAG: hypothetical protein QOI36_5241 [Pseudonocardiales bacterium]|nr:hypothetical protein [Pseudonocardia sp.]MDT7653835.1 hypothetical protein [Pseudonocardiales bacterium]